jgi:hypothetical protein
MDDAQRARPLLKLPGIAPVCSQSQSRSEGTLPISLTACFRDANGQRESLAAELIRIGCGGRI